MRIGLAYNEKPDSAPAAESDGTGDAFAEWDDPSTISAVEQALGLFGHVIRLEAHEYGGSVSVSLVPCRIFNRPAFLLRTDLNEKGIGHHPRNIIEIATDLRLREQYQLKDGDWVEVEFPEDPRPVH